MPQGPELKVLPAMASDITQIFDLVELAYRGTDGWTHDGHLLDGPHTTIERIQKQMKNPLCQYFKCVFQNNPDQLIGCVFTEREPEKNQIFIGTLCVQPSYQNQGIGKMIMRTVEEYARNLQCSAVNIKVITARKELFQWYTRQGYRLTGEKMDFPVGIYGKFLVSPEELVLVTMQRDFV